METSSARLPVREKIGYGLGDAASNIFFQTVNMFLLFYYTDVFGISPAVAGTLFVVARFWDALIDPFVGALADRTRTRWGSYRPYLLWMALPFGIIGYATFANPELSDQGKLVYAYVTYFLLMTVYAAINVPYSALMGVMTPSSPERTSLSSYRFVGAFGGQLLIAIGILPLVRILGGGDKAHGFKVTMAIFSVIAVVLFFATFLMTKERIKPKEQKDPSIRKDIGSLLANRPWVIMVVAALLTLSGAAVRWAVTPHFFKYDGGYDDSEFVSFLDRTSLFNVVGVLSFLVGIFFTGALVRRFGKRNLLIALTLLNAAALLVFFFIPRDAYWTMVGVNALASLLAGPTPALVWAIYTDVADYGEWRFGRRTTGLAFAAAMFAQKFGMSIGGGLAGWLLGIYGFEADKVQSEETLRGLCLLFSILPGVFAVANGIVLLWYPLTDEMVGKIEEELAERRAKDEDGDDVGGAGAVEVAG
ncbi:MFS transporter [Luteolibacter sp. Populi]|uniref:MFS transporter n=1 Tax=Luteolibacter sp. Populi TaxID=3230487 RepID=UPI003465A81B